MNPIFQEVKDSFKDSNGSMVVDFLQLYKMTELAADLPYSTTKISLNYDGPALKFTILTHKDTNADFHIDSASGSCNSLASPVIIQAKLLRLLLRGFQAFPQITISLSSKGIEVKSEVFSSLLVADPS